jgi:hypothetical protein
MPARLAIAYGIIALLVLAGAAFAWWTAHNSRSRRSARARERLAERYRKRDQAAEVHH